MKKYLSMILIIALLLSSVPISAADDGSPLFTYAANYSGYASFDDFIAAQGYDSVIPHPSPMVSEPIRINKSVYDKYGLIVYGNEKIINYDSLPAGYPHENSSAEEIYNDKKTGTTGYRYLGYSQSGEVVTNAYYPPDAPPSDTNKWIEQYSDIANAQGSWNAVTDGSLREYMTSHWIGGNGINTNPNDINTQYTVETINNTRSMGALNTYPIDGVTDSYKRTLLLTAGGWYTNFSVRTERGKYYQTWIGDGMASNARVDQWLTLNLQNNDIAVTMASDQQFVEVNTSYTAVIVPDSQYMKKEHVKQFETSISKDGSVIDGSEAEFSVLRKTVNRTVRINRSELVVGTQEVEISGSYVLDTIFKNDPKKSGNLTRKVIVTVEEPAVPTASCLVTANPRYKTSSGSDVDVSITADISLYKVTTANVANIAVWLDGECQYANIINPTVTFHRTIDGAPFVDNPDKRIKQPWNVTVNVTLKDGRVLEASGDDMTVVVGEPKPPEVKVNAPKTAKVGDTKGITVRGSSVTGALDYLVLNDGSTDIAVEHPTDGYLNTQYEFTREGEQTFTGVAIDTLGYSGYGEDTTMVLPPTVDAVIHTEGQLKPYRKITVSSMQSDSPDKFPIIDSQTDWWVSSGTINAATGVYSPADPDGSRKFDFCVPTAGTINTSVTLKNTLGYSGQASKTITIAPDEPPVAVMELVNKVYRNPNDANNATISVINRSYSPDGDKIGLLSVMYWYDSDNDGNYYEHPVHLVYQGANMPQVDFKVSSVGKYMIRTRVDETYTAMSGMTPVYLYDTTYDGYFDEKHVVEVDNIAPSVNAQVTNDNEPVTINYFNINGYTTDAYIQSQFASQLTPILNSNGYATIALETHNVASVEKARETTAIGAPVESAINYYSVGKYIPEINVIEGARVLYYLNANRTGIARTFRYVNYERVTEKNTGDREWKDNVGRERYYYNLSDKQIMFYAYVNDNDVGYEINGGFINFPYGTGVYVFDYYLNIANYYSSYDTVPEVVFNKFIMSDYMTASMLYPEDDYYSYTSSGVRTNKRFGYTTPTNFTSSTGAVWPINQSYKILNNYTTHERISGYDDTIYNNFWNYEWYNSLVDYVHTIKANSFETLGKKVAVLAFKEPEQLLGNDDYINALASLLSTYDVVPVIVCDNAYAPYFSSLLSTKNGLLINSLDGVGNALVEVLSSMKQDSEETLCILNTDSLSFDTLYYDYENDALYSKGIKATHVDTFFDNNNGFYANSGVYQTLFANTKLTLPNVGIYEIEPSVRDNPVGTNNALDSYRKWSTDAKKTKVIVHRKPIADFDLNIKLEYSNIYYNWKYLFDFQNRSYDLDHMSDANHGIVDYVLQYQKADRATGEPLTDWIDASMFSEYTDIIYRFGTGMYRINARLKVKDPEGAWSDYCEKDMFFLGYYVYSKLYATLRTDNPSNPLTAFRPGNYVEWYDIHFTDYYIFQDISNLNYYLEISLLDNGTPVPGVPVKKITDPSQIYDPQYRDHYWNNQKFYIPDVEGLENKTYQVEIAAIIDDDMDGDYDRRITKIEDITLYANNPPTISASLSATSLRQGNDNTVWVNVNDPDHDNLLLNISVKKDGETYESKGYALSYPYVSTSLPLVDLDAGTYAVTATVSDGVESTSKSLAFTVLPNTPPAVAVNVTSPYLFETDTNTAFVSVYDAEGDDLALDVTVLKDGTVYRTFSYNKTSPYTDEVIALSNLSAGTYTVRAFAADDYGNATATATFPVYVNSPPYITAEIASPEILDGDSNTLTTHLTDIDPQNLFVQTELYKEGVLYSRQNTTVAPVGGIYSDVLFTFPNLPIGSYLGQVAAWDGYATSNYVNYSFNVIPRNLPPSVTVGVTPETLFAGQKATVAMLFDDGDHEPLTVTLTVLKDGATYDVSTFSVAWLGAQYDVIKKSYEGLPEGTYTVKAVVSDGTATDEDVKTFVVQPLHISAFEITGAWNHWDGRTDYRGVYLTPDVHRFLSLETVTFHASIKGLPETVTVTLSPELMAMTYTDPYGVVYDYEELVGYEVTFPMALSMVAYDEATSISLWEGKYLLPLAPSSISWEDVRKRSPYGAELTASQGLSSVKASIDDVEITGNIYDRISLQPVY